MSKEAQKEESNQDFAIVESGGKQYRVVAGGKVSVEKLPGNEGDDVKLDRVLLLSQGGKVQVGTPLVEGASVTAKILGNEKDKKVIIFKKKRRKGYKLKKGHRQEHTVLEVSSL